MPQRPPRRPRPPIDQARLEELALSYVGRFATTRAKLASYLSRKLRERGWSGDRAPDVEALVERHVRTGLIDDAAYAMAKAEALGRRGYGANRVRQQLRVAGISEEDGGDALDHAAGEAATAALRFAQRRRFGPFAAKGAEPAQRQKQIAAMVRAGHPLRLALLITACPPGDIPDAEQLRPE